MKRKIAKLQERLEILVIQYQSNPHPNLLAEILQIERKISELAGDNIRYKTSAKMLVLLCLLV